MQSLTQFLTFCLLDYLSKRFFTTNGFNVYGCVTSVHSDRKFIYKTLIDIVA